MQRKHRIAKVVSNDIETEKKRTEIETRVATRFRNEVCKVAGIDYLSEYIYRESQAPCRRLST